MAVDMFLKLDGINGESQDELHRQWIEVESFSWGLTSMNSSATGGAGAGRASFQDFHFKKQVDKSSPSLMLACASGEHIKGAQLSVRKAGGDSLGTVKSGEEFLKIKLSDLLVSSFMQKCDAAGGLEDPQDSFSLNFARIEFTAMSESAGWDLKTNKAIIAI